LRWQSLPRFQPLSLTSVLAKSIEEHLVQHPQPSALGFLKPCGLCLAPYWIHHLTRSPPRSRLYDRNYYSRSANFRVRKCFQVHFAHQFRVDDSQVNWFGGRLIFQFSSREVVCRQSFWLRWSLWQFKCSCTIMLEIWPGCFDDLFGIWIVSLASGMRVSIRRFLQYSMPVLAAQPHLQQVVDLGYSVQWSVLRLVLQFHVVFIFRVNQCCAITHQFSLIGWSKLPCDDFSPSISLVVLDSLQPTTSRPREKLASSLTPCGTIQNMLYATSERSAYFECVSTCWRYQLVISANHNVLLIFMVLEW